MTIDDEKFIRHSFRAFLEDMNYEVFEAENGRIGVEVCRRVQPDLVLLDLRMPELDGLQVLKILIKDFPHLPIVVVSGVGIASDVIEAIHYGAWDYVLKPIQDLQILKHAITNALEKAQLLKDNKKYQENLEDMVVERTRKLEETNQELKREIKNRKYIEENLFKSQKMLSSILETVPDIIYRLNREGKINFISNAVENYDYNTNDFLERKIDDFIHPDDLDRSFWHLRTRRTGTRRTQNFEIRLFKKEESRYCPTFMLESEGIYSDDNKAAFLGTQGVFRDISLRKEAENKVKKSLAEKESLLREVHHRVKNNMQVILSLLSLQMKDIKNEEIQNILKDSQNRIMSMAIVHESIYKTDNFAEIRMDNFVRNLYSQIAQSYKIQQQIDLHFQLEKLFVTLDSSVPLAIILNELFTNIFKHAFIDQKNCQIVVNMKRIDATHAIVSVMDNGVGMPDNMNLEKPETMGLSLITTLTRQLSGKLSIEKLDPGTKISVSFDTKIIQDNF